MSAPKPTRKAIVRTCTLTRAYNGTGFGDARRVLEVSDVQDELVRHTPLLASVQHLRVCVRACVRA
jgi:hypothetical protein